MPSEDWIRLAERLEDIGAQMRHQQKEYFRTRSKTALEESRKLERRFDSVLEAMANLSKEPKLF